MNKLTIAVMLVAALGLASCDKSSRFGGGDGAGAGAGAGDFVAGSPSDPTSPAYFSQTIGDRVLFAVDQSTLSPEAQAILIKQAAWLNENPEYNAIIEGHADEQGTREYNIALGARRASAVQGFLIDHGVAPNRLKTISYGKERPLAICSDESCYAQNRRAVTVLTAGGAGV
ncbi:MAG: peptidoglycan-associated lipoprotein Pal [Alphaproteobacteria bacterium]|nr:MAG: peptidoglycan-associated lipoprotein Pal [Alphaproteobacteria bacterium]